MGVACLIIFSLLFWSYLTHKLWNGLPTRVRERLDLATLRQALQLCMVYVSGVAEWLGRMHSPSGGYSIAYLWIFLSDV